MKARELADKLVAISTANAATSVAQDYADPSYDNPVFLRPMLELASKAGRLTAWVHILMGELTPDQLANIERRMGGMKEAA